MIWIKKLYHWLNFIERRRDKVLETAALDARKRLSEVMNKPYEDKDFDLWMK